MTKSLSSDAIADIECRCERATPEPWKSYIEGRDHDSGDSFIMTGQVDIYLIGASPDDQDFIAHARQDLPALLAEVRRLKSLLPSAL